MLLFPGWGALLRALGEGEAGEKPPPAAPQATGAAPRAPACRRLGDVRGATPAMPCAAAGGSGLWGVSGLGSQRSPSKAFAPRDLREGGAAGAAALDAAQWLYYVCTLMATWRMRLLRPSHTPPPRVRSPARTAGGGQRGAGRGRPGSRGSPLCPLTCEKGRCACWVTCRAEPGQLLSSRGASLLVPEVLGRAGVHLGSNPDLALVPHPTSPQAPEIWRGFISRRAVGLGR